MEEEGGQVKPSIGLLGLAMSQEEPANRPKCLDGIRDRVETESSHPDQPGHVLSGSSGSTRFIKHPGLMWILHWIMCIHNGIYC